MAAGICIDHYNILGLRQGATADEVKKAYRALSKVYHPDKAANADEVTRRERERQMVALNVAYQILASPRQRQEYDLSREEPKKCTSPFTRPGSGDERRARSWCPPVSGNTAKPRYQSGAKYTQRSRMARRMDPAQYTQHVAENCAGPKCSPDAQPARPSRPPMDSGISSRPPVAPPPGVPRNPMWLERQLEISRKWEEAHCPEPTEDQYQWRRASNDLLRNLKERRHQREQIVQEYTEFSAGVQSA